MVLLVIVPVFALVSGGCGEQGAVRDAEPRRAEAEPTAPPSNGAPAVFSEVATSVGIDFVHNNGSFGQKWLPETMGSGCAWVDFDTDGDPDALLLSGRDFAGHPTGRRQTMALYRNEGGRFVDVTAAAGLGAPIYGMGVTHGDYDADGDPDLYVSALGPNRLYRNDGGRFVDVAASLGVDDPGFGSSASFVDSDDDGDLDLFSLNYVQWTPETDIRCTLDGTNKSYCTPEAYRGASPRLFRNDRGTFTDVTVQAGVFDSTAKALGVVCFDYNQDGREDLFVANDTQPNFLFQNLGDGTFEEVGMRAGVAFDESGKARGAMGVDVADYDHCGMPSLTIGNFSNEMLSLYHNEGHGFFIDAAPTSGVGAQSLLTLAFGMLFVDYDLDGHPDIFVANGHVENEIQKVQRRVSYEQPPHLFRNLGAGRFTDVAPTSRRLAEPMVARGSASADFDGDGDLDLLVTTCGGPAKLLRNDGADGRRAVRIRLRGGAGSNLDAYGAKVELTAGGTRRTAWSHAGSSYLSQSENVITFGLGDLASADEIVVTWPSGKVGRVRDVAAGSRLTLTEADAVP
jgi:hypothetical protein